MRRLFNKQTFSRVGKLFAIPVGVALLSCILFFLVALIPQSAIQENASRAAAELLAQPQHPSVLNVGELQYTMDNYTDCQILLQSYNLTISEPDSILSNPKHLSPPGQQQYGYGSGRGGQPGRTE